MDSIVISAHVDIDPTQAVINRTVIGRNGSSMLELFNRLLITPVKGKELRQPAIPRPIMGTQFDSMVVGLLCILQPAHLFVGPGQPAISVIVGGFSHQSTAEFRTRIFVFAGRE